MRGSVSGVAIACLAATVLLSACRTEAPGERTAGGSGESSPATGRTSSPFVDATDAAGLDWVHVNGMSGALYMPEMMSSGAALFDYDNDGDLDLYLVQGGPLGPRAGRAPAASRDRLFRNDLSGDPPRAHFVDVSARSGDLGSGYGMGVAVGDPDGDGAPDLYVANFGSNTLLHNAGDGTFVDVTPRSGTDDGRWTVPATFFDADGDGDEDLYVGNYVAFAFDDYRPCRTANGSLDYCAPGVYEPETDRLFFNRGGLSFVDATAASGIGGGPVAPALGVVARDFDGDGHDDLYVANDQAANHLWMSRGDDTFVDEAVLRGVAVNADGQPEASMGVAAGDADGDGDTDIFLSHLRGESNTLYGHDRAGLFTDRTVAAGLSAASRAMTGFGTGFIDYDRDGRPDLFVANGAVQVIEELAAAGDAYPLHQRDQLFRNLGGGRFFDVSARAGPLTARSGVSRAVAFGDVDNDGRMDLVVVENAGRARLYRGRGGGRWLGVRVVHGESGADRIGTRVTAATDGLATSGEVRRDGSYAAANDPRVLLGLGGAREVRVTLEVGSRRIVWAGATAGYYAVWPVFREAR